MAGTRQSGLVLDGGVTKEGAGRGRWWGEKTKEEGESILDPETMTTFEILVSVGCSSLCIQNNAAVLRERFQVGWENSHKFLLLLSSTFHSSPLLPSSHPPLGWLCVAPWGFQWAWASLARPVSLDGIEETTMRHPDEGRSWAGTRGTKEEEEGGSWRETQVVSKRGRVGWGDAQGAETIVDCFNHSDAICSTPFFELTEDFFCLIPGGMSVWESVRR